MGFSNVVIFSIRSKRKISGFLLNLRKLARKMRSSCARKLQASKLLEGPQEVLRDLDFSYLNLGIRDLKAKSRRDSVLKVCAGGGTPEKPPGLRNGTKF